MGLPIRIDVVLNQQIVEKTRIDYKREWNPGNSQGLKKNNFRFNPISG